MLYPISMDVDGIDLLGYIDQHGELKIEPQFIFAEQFYSGLALTKNLKHQYNYIDMEGNIKINGSSYESADHFINGYAHVIVNDKLGFIDTEGKMVISPELDYVIDPENLIGFFIDDKALICINDKFGMIDTRGDYLIPPQYNEIDDVYKELFLIEKDYKNLYFLTTISKIKRDDSEFCWCSEIGESKEDCNCFYFGALREDRASIRVWFNEFDYYKIGFIDIHGTLLIHPQFSDTRDFQEGIAAVEIKNKWGFINKRGDFIVRPKYEWVSDFKYGVAVVLNSDGFGVIDSSGKEIIKPIFDQLDYFINGAAQFTFFADNPIGIDYEDTGYINSNGQVIWYSNRYRKLPKELRGNFI